MGYYFGFARSVEQVSRGLARYGAELDQRLTHAFTTAELHWSGFYTDAAVFLALVRSNPLLLKDLPALDERVKSAGAFSREMFWSGHSLNIVLQRALVDRRELHTLGTRDFLLALVRLGTERGNKFFRRPFSIDLLAFMLSGSATRSMKEVADLENVLHSLTSDADQSAEDFQYVLTVENGLLS